MKTTSSPSVERALGWFLNGLNELDAASDPVEDLASVLGDERLARYLMTCFSKLTPAVRGKFQKPAVGDVFQRELIASWVDSFSGQA